MGVWGSGGSEFAGYDYVQTDPPANPSEGQTWYDVDADGAFVYDGAGWVEMTVTDHGQLSGIQAGQHRSDSNIISTVDGQVDADTVDGSHASDLGAPNSTDTGNVETGWTSSNFNRTSIPDEYDDAVYQGKAIIAKARIHVTDDSGDTFYGQDAAGNRVWSTGSSTGWHESPWLPPQSYGFRLGMQQDSNGTSNADDVEVYVISNPDHTHSI